MRPSRTVVRRFGTAGAAVLVASLCGGCSWFDRGPATSSVSVFDVEVGQCFSAPPKVAAQIDSLTQVGCTTPHTLEAFAILTYSPDPGSYPGDQKLTAFAQGGCAQKFSGYVGVDYRDSSYFFTYLFPSPRSWDQKDRSIPCFITTTGGTVTGSAKGSKK
jgi:hypothetical protein